MTVSGDVIPGSDDVVKLLEKCLMWSGIVLERYDIAVLVSSIC